MNTKIKILIGVLVVGVVLIAGWWIWNGQTIKNPRGICGPKGMGINYDVLYCDETCNVDDDCKFTCGCGAINKNEICHDEGITYDCVDHEVKCKEGRCIIGKEILLKGVTITTDKTEYEQGDRVKIIVTNNLDYLVTPGVGNLRPDRFLGENYGIGLIEKFEDDKWVAIEPVWRCESEFSSCFTECLYEYSFRPGETRVFEWDQTVRICNKLERTEKIENAGAGKYRVASSIWFTKERTYKTIYSNEFTIKEKITCDWCGRACVRYPVSKEDCEKAGGIFFKQCACPEVAPPEDLICVEENGKCVQKSKVEGKPPIVGGPCSYDEFRGKCKITSIFNENKIRFKFIPTEPLNLENIGWVKSKEDITNREYEEYVGYLGLKCLDKYPITGEDLERCNIKENTVFDCEIGLITKGTCTPIVFKFCE